MSHHSLVPEFLSSAQRFGIDLSLERMLELMRRLNNPQNSCKYLHVAGTNGKGSVVSYLSSILACAGYKTGIYTSPYIERFSERIRILQGQDSVKKYYEDSSFGEISAEDLLYYTNKIEIAVSEMIKDHFEHPTEFELVSAVAMLYFSKEECDYVVLETGLGGRFDATNIIDNPICSVITAIGYDHMDCLGDTIDKIAYEKAGIIKRGCPVFLTDLTKAGLSKDESKLARSAIVDVCLKKEASLDEIDCNDIKLIDYDIDGQSFEVLDFPLPLFTRMLGDHQRMNATLAVQVLKAWVSPQDIQNGVRHMFWKARNEVLSRYPLILLDGAHNPQSMQSFVNTSNTVMRILNKDRARLIIGMLIDKDICATLRILKNNISFDFEDVCCVSFNHQRATPSEDLLKLCREVFECDAMFYNNSSSGYNVQSIMRASADINEECLSIVKQSLDDDIPIFCVGSLYLAGEVRSIFMQVIKEMNR